MRDEQRAERKDSNLALIEECAACVPTTWLHPLLSGPDKVGEFADRRAVEKLLTEIRKQILALSAGKSQ